MSRVGKAPVKVPNGVKFDISGASIKAKGPKGELSHTLPEAIQAKMENNAIQISLKDPKDAANRNLHGLTRTLVANMAHGVSEGFTRDLEIVGVGFRAATKGQTLSLTIGYSHPIDYELPKGITAKVDANTKISVTGADKVLVGMVAAKIRSFREPEPYQGKGIRYANEHIIRKQGKAAAGASGGK